MTADEVTLDRFLGGRLTIAQPKKGFRAGHDTVLLAASVAPEAGSRCLELGAGAGIASLCLAARIRDALVLGVEVDEDMVRLANENAARNGVANRVRFEQRDVTQIEGIGLFDHVFFNPPFHSVSGNPSASAQRDRAMRDRGKTISAWTRVALLSTRSGGTVTAILRADRADEMLDVRDRDNAVLFPLFPHEGEAPKRAIVQIEKGRPGGVRRAPGLVLHTNHGRNTEGAEAVLRHGAQLRLA